MRRVAYALLTVAWIGASSSYAQPYAAEESTDEVSEQDLLVVARMSGTSFERYDYALPFDFCFNVYLETLLGDDGPALSPFGHLCQLAGSHRLMILWQHAGDEVRIVAHTHRRGGTAGGSTTKILSMPGITGQSVSAVPTPTFSPGAKTLVADFGYSAADGTANAGEDLKPRHLRLRVLVELKANPDQAESAGGSLVP